MPTYVGGCNPFILSYRCEAEPWVPPIEGGNRIYWEVQIDGTNAGFPNFDGYVGLIDIRVAQTQYDDNVAPVSAGSNGFGYRGAGQIWLGGSGSSSSSVLVDLQLFGAGDRVMLALDLENGNLWVGVNGVWEDGDYPLVDPALVQVIDPNRVCFNGIRAPYIHVRRPGDAARVHTVLSEFLYPVPAGFRPLTVDAPETPQIYDWAALQTGFTEYDDFRGVENTSSAIQNYYPIKAPVDDDFLRAVPAEMTGYMVDAYLGGLSNAGFVVLDTEVFMSQTNWGAFTASDVEIFIEVTI